MYVMVHNGQLNGDIFQVMGPTQIKQLNWPAGNLILAI